MSSHVKRLYPLTAYLDLALCGAGLQVYEMQSTRNIYEISVEPSGASAPACTSASEKGNKILSQCQIKRYVSLLLVLLCLWKGPFLPRNRDLDTHEITRT